jgi:hypothetical protein
MTYNHLIIIWSTKSMQVHSWLHSLHFSPFGNHELILWKPPETDL